MHIKGPFYGLLGYSQGSALIPIYLGKVFPLCSGNRVHENFDGFDRIAGLHNETLKANTQNTFNRVMLYCGYLPTTHQGWYSSYQLHSSALKP